MGIVNTRTQKRAAHMTGVFPKASSFALLLAAFALLSLSGCRNPFGPGGTDEGGPTRTGILSLTIGGQGLGRTIMPEIWPENDIVRFEFEAVPYPGTGDPIPLMVLTRDPGTPWPNDPGMTEIELHAGTWNLYVTAFVAGGGGESYAVARGSLENIVVLSGETVVGNVVLFPVANIGGRGTFFWEIVFSADIAGVDMEIMQFGVDTYGNSTTIPYQGPFPLNLDYSGTATDSLYLDVGLYLVVFTLHPYQGPSMEVSAILHIYQNMVSRFTGGEAFRNFIFPRSLLCYILDAWEWNASTETGEWDFVEHEITAGHFYHLLGIRGIDTLNFGAAVGWFNENTNPHNVPGDLEGLKALVDAALIGINKDIIVDIIAAGIYAGQSESETAAAIRALEWFGRNTGSGGDFYFDWCGADDTLTITVPGPFTIKIDFAEEIDDPDDILWVAAAVGGPPTTAINFVFASPVEGLVATDITIG